MNKVAKASLTAALNDVLRDRFDGVPSNEEIAAALDRISASDHLSLRHAILLDALARALEGGTADGWKFEKIKGPKGPRRTKSVGAKRREIADRYRTNLAEGGDEFARAKAVEGGDQSAKEAYAEYRPGERLKRLLRSRSSHEERVEEIRHRRLRSTPKKY